MNTSPKAIRVIAEWDAPAHAAVPVVVHYSEKGEKKRAVMPASAPVRYDRLVASISEEELPAVDIESAGYGSARQAARSLFYAGRSAAQKLGAPTRLQVPVLDMRWVEPNNVGHLMTNIIPLALLAKKVAGENVALLLKRRTKGPFAALLDYFGVKTITDTGRVRGDVVRLHGMRGLSATSLFESHDTYGFFFNDTVFRNMTFPAMPGYERIFIVRRPPRDLENQAEVQALTDRYGYRPIFMEDIPLPEQIAIGAHAQHVLGIHGSALSYLTANPSVGSVIELFPPNVYHEVHSAVFGDAVRSYHKILPDFNMEAALHWPTVLASKGRRFAVDAGVLAQVLHEIHGDA